MALFQRISLKTVLPFALFGLFAALLVFGITVQYQPPVVFTVTPDYAAPGDVITIYGRNFGDTRLRSDVIIGSVRPNAAGYVAWSDTEIQVRVPEAAASGLLVVRTEHGRSDGVLFTNRRRQADDGTSDSVARAAARSVGVPIIESVSPERSTVGSLMSVRGRYFGEYRRQGKVFFSWGHTDDGEPLPDLPDYGVIPQAEGLDFAFWSDREIRVRVPYGAVSGSLYLIGPRGRSDAAPVEIAEQVGTTVYGDRVSYTIAQGFAVAGVTADDGEGVVEEVPRVRVWLPGPVESPSQRNPQTVRRESTPLFRAANGLDLYAVGLDGGRERRVITVDVFSATSTIIPDRVRDNYDTTSPLYRRYTGSDPHLALDDASVQAIAARERARYANPFTRAGAAYDVVRNGLTPGSRAPTIGEAFETSQGNYQNYAVAAVSIIRAMGIPARIVAGFRVDADERLVPHWWSEFYIVNFGWVSMDPFYADLEEAAGVDSGFDYFAELDNRRIAFSHGLLQVRPADLELPLYPEETAARSGEVVSLDGRAGRVLYHLPGVYSLQTLYGEGVGVHDFAVEFPPPTLLMKFPR